MDREQIIRMAREADIDWHKHWDDEENRLERFAALVAAAERDQIIALNAPEIERINEYIKTLEEAVAAEREACAKVVEQAGVDGYGTLAAAAMIRARGEK